MLAETSWNVHLAACHWWSLSMSPVVLVFGRRQKRDIPHAQGAGVQKAPRHEVAGSVAPAWQPTCSAARPLRQRSLMHRWRRSLRRPERSRNAGSRVAPQLVCIRPRGDTGRLCSHRRHAVLNEDAAAVFSIPDDVQLRSPSIAPSLRAQLRAETGRALRGDACGPELQPVVKPNGSNCRWPVISGASHRHLHED